jgi:hypothetical protein
VADDFRKVHRAEHRAIKRRLHLLPARLA